MTKEAFVALVTCFNDDETINFDATRAQVRRQVQQLLNGYVQSPAILSQIDDYITPPGLGNRAGGLGSIALAMSAGKN